MLQSRSSSRTRAKNLSNSPSPSSRLGRLFPPFGRDSVTPALGSNLHFRPVELGSLDPHAMQNNRELTPSGRRHPLRVSPQIDDQADHHAPPLRDTHRAPATVSECYLVRRADRRACPTAEFL